MVVVPEMVSVNAALCVILIVSSSVQPLVPVTVTV
jgi:hypothetical protein